MLPAGRHELVEELASRGVLQSIASYNLYETVLSALHYLDLDRFFLYPQAGLGISKPALVKQAMAKLNLVRNSDVVYVDNERSNVAEVAEALPGIVSLHIDDFKPDDWFSKHSYSDDDRQRVQRYKDEERREASSLSFGEDRQAFLRSLNLRCEIGLVGPSEWARAVDLVQKSNQFSALAEEPEEIWLDTMRDSTYVARVQDKYGDYGLTGVLALDKHQELRVLVVSCRLAGKGVGSAILGWAVNQQLPTMHAEWRATDFNQAVDELFKFYGFDIAESEVTRFKYASRTGPAVALPPWVEVVA